MGTEEKTIVFGEEMAQVTGQVSVEKRTPSYAIPGACSVVIFGATGDLTTRKLMPALYALAVERLLPHCFAIVGVARNEVGREGFQRQMRDAVDRFSRFGIREEIWERFARNLYYLPAPSDEDEVYDRLRDLLSQVDQSCGTEGNHLFYLAIPPTAVAGVVRRLGEAGLTESGDERKGWTRIVIEKPFGRDLDSARELNHQVLEVFQEPQVYRIDHYLGKETVQNILAFRFGNSIFEPIWNRRYVDHVQITAAEDLGVEGRGRYYDTAGALRDMMQNHMLQLLSLVAMEPPPSFDAEAIRDEKVKLLRSIRQISPEAVLHQTARGQYTAGRINGRRLTGYREEDGVAPDSTTETYVALKLTIDNWRWAGVPFYFRTGKSLARKVTEVTIHYQKPPHLLFQLGRPLERSQANPLQPNRLSLRIQPDERTILRFGLKPPGERIQLAPVVMDFGYREGFGGHLPEAYERLILDCMRGDSTLFIRGDEMELAWALMTPILEAWEKADADGLCTYPAGSWGPKEADDLIGRDGRQWVYR